MKEAYSSTDLQIYASIGGKGPTATHLQTKRRKQMRYCDVHDGFESSICNRPDSALSVKKVKTKWYNITFLKRVPDDDICCDLLFIHTFSGCEY